MATSIPDSQRRDVPAGDGRAGPSVTVRYWAAARQAAGCAEERLAGATVGEVLEAARDRHDDPTFAKVLGVSSLLLGDRPLGHVDVSDVAVTGGEVLEVLPPFAGG